jgi:hypothetical protein
MELTSFLLRVVIPVCVFGLMVLNKKRAVEKATAPLRARINKLQDDSEMFRRRLLVGTAQDVLLNTHAVLIDSETMNVNEPLRDLKLPSIRQYMVSGIQSNNFLFLQEEIEGIFEDLKRIVHQEDKEKKSKELDILMSAIDTFDETKRLLYHPVNGISFYKLIKDIEGKKAIWCQKVTFYLEESSTNEPSNSVS